MQKIVLVKFQFKTLDLIVDQWLELKWLSIYIVYVKLNRLKMSFKIGVSIQCFSKTSAIKFVLFRGLISTIEIIYIVLRTPPPPPAHTNTLQPTNQPTNQPKIEPAPPINVRSLWVTLTSFPFERYLKKTIFQKNYRNFQLSNNYNGTGQRNTSLT